MVRGCQIYESQTPLMAHNKSIVGQQEKELPFLFIPTAVASSARMYWYHT